MRRLNSASRLVTPLLTWALSLALVALAAEGARAVELVSRPEAGPFEAGERFDVTVEIGSAEEPASGVFGVGLELHFDPNVFAPIDVSIGDFFPPGALRFVREEDGYQAIGLTLTEDAALPTTGTLAICRFEVRAGAGDGGYSFPLENTRVVDGAGTDVPTTVVAEEVTVEGDPTGACCLPDGSCLMTTATACSQQNGEYLGNDVPCDPDPCTDPMGACCAEDGTCVATTQLDCDATGGSYLGDGSDCQSDPCPDLSGACCESDGTCRFLTPSQCASLGATFLGSGTSCEPNPCPQPSGSLFVDSEPVGASIRLDGELTGEVTPFLFLEVEPGIHCVEWFRPGYGGCSDGSDCPGVETTVVEGDTVSVDCDLVPFFIDVLSTVGTLEPPIVKIGNFPDSEYRVTLDLESEPELVATLSSDLLFLAGEAVTPLSRVDLGGDRFAVQLHRNQLLSQLPHALAPGEETQVEIPVHGFTGVKWVRFDLSIRFKRTTFGDSPRGPGRIQAYAIPNPFQGEVVLEWQNPEREQVRIQFYDASGRKVAEVAPESSMDGTFTWDGRSIGGEQLPTGVYHYRISIGTSQGEGRLLLLRR